MPQSKCSIMKLATVVIVKSKEQHKKCLLILAIKVKMYQDFDYNCIK